MHETDYVMNTSEDSQFEYTPLGTIMHLLG